MMGLALVDQTLLETTELMSSRQNKFHCNRDNNNLIAQPLQTFKNHRLVLISPVVSLKVDEVGMPVWIGTGQFNQNTIITQQNTTYV